MDRPKVSIVYHHGAAGRIQALATLLHLGGVLVPAPRAQDLDVRTLARRTGRDVASVARRLLAGAAAAGGRVPVRHATATIPTGRTGRLSQTLELFGPSRWPVTPAHRTISWENS